MANCMTMVGQFAGLVGGGETRAVWFLAGAMEVEVGR